ncbi:UDP-glucose 4-epimerase GalE [Sphingomicrobium sediminis]|uniref:UDP-glucose 4-epimerase n=1 Tax=Sphingomicrobium sediminis TaxID=2950949 RepID=A0A9X2J2T9_9SPHN|nr:UDP-glucose 4-epimerase GalE [Sphingomicrobium sediminis]MCM8556631.1 UDP-glucose 4-epimerase GalE [Sphingomicrobium sediminis]
MRILLTGGTGYIGSHCAVALVEAGHEPVLVDNFANSKPDVADRIGQIVGRELTSEEGDIRDAAFLDAVFAKHHFDAVIHFAALKDVIASVDQPLEYYDVNVGGLTTLLAAMDRADVRSIVFSSTANIYGEPDYVPIDEQHPVSARNPYGQSKLAGERMISDIVAADPRWRGAILRYFNPVGAHETGLIGEDPSNRPSNLMPLVVAAAADPERQLSIFGTDYPTKDGTAERDFIHVSDLAEAHVAALDHLPEGGNVSVHNVGTGKSTSVRMLIHTFAMVNAQPVQCVEKPRREGDIASVWSSADKAEAELGWRAKRDLVEMCRDAWNFHRRGHGG